MNPNMMLTTTITASRVKVEKTEKSNYKVVA